jgi:hypothetical protein
VLVIDSLSHAWAGKDGLLERVDKKGGFTGGGWKEATPLQNRMVDAILTCKAHVIVTLRQKTEYAIEKNTAGKMVPRKVGLAPIQREGLEYEFDVMAALDVDNNLSIEKTRCSALNGRVWKHQNPEIAAMLRQWLTDGAPAVEAPPVAKQADAAVETVKKVFPGAQEASPGPKAHAPTVNGASTSAPSPTDTAQPAGGAKNTGTSDRTKRLGVLFTSPSEGLGWKRPAIVQFLVTHYGVNQLSALDAEQVVDCERQVIAEMTKRPANGAEVSTGPSQAPAQRGGTL